MLFTNKTLEINKITSREGKAYRVLELFNIYAYRYFTQVEEEMTDKIIFVKDNVTHRYLDIDKTEKGFIFKNCKSDKLTIVLDMLDYKQFLKNSRIEVAKESEINFNKLRDFKLANRFNVNWTVALLQVEEDGFGILKLTTTSGRVSYLIVKDKKANIVPLRLVNDYLKDNNIDFQLENATWELL